MQTVFCREGDWVQLPLRVIRKINGRKVFAIGAVFCSIQIGNYCLNRLKETKARPEGFTNNKVFKPRRFCMGNMYLCPEYY